MRGSQIDEIYEILWKTTGLKMGVHFAKGLVTCGRGFGIVDAIAHDESLP
jgi:hypothetical protein